MYKRPLSLIIRPTWLLSLPKEGTRHFPTVASGENRPPQPIGDVCNGLLCKELDELTIFVNVPDCESTRRFRIRKMISSSSVRALILFVVLV